MPFRIWPADWSVFVSIVSPVWKLGWLKAFSTRIFSPTTENQGFVKLNGFNDVLQETFQACSNKLHSHLTFTKPYSFKPELIKYLHLTSSMWISPFLFHKALNSKYMLKVQQNGRINSSNHRRFKQSRGKKECIIWFSSTVSLEIIKLDHSRQLETPQTKI